MTRDPVAQAVNSASDAESFAQAALLVRSHVASGRDPGKSHHLCLSLLVKGHWLISQGMASPCLISAWALEAFATSPPRGTMDR